jgi:hypothetical protein
MTKSNERRPGYRGRATSKCFGLVQRAFDTRLASVAIQMSVSVSTKLAHAKLDMFSNSGSPRESDKHPGFHAAVLTRCTARNSTLAATIRLAFSSRYRRFLYPRPRLISIRMLALSASTTPKRTFVWQ